MPSLDETDPVLIAALKALMDNYGPEGVRLTVSQMIQEMISSRPTLDDGEPRTYEQTQVELLADYYADLEKPKPLIQDLAMVLNRHQRDNVTNTPDFLLAEYMIKALEAGEALISRRVYWWGQPTEFEELLKFKAKTSAEREARIQAQNAKQ